MLYSEKQIIPVPYEGGKIVVCGHTPRKDGHIADFGHTICIDTFAYGGGWLTSLEMHSGYFIQSNETGALQKGSLTAQI